MSEVVALADSHGGVEICRTIFIRPLPWVEDGSRLLPTLIFKVREYSNTIFIVGTDSGLMIPYKLPTPHLLGINYSVHVGNFIKM